MTWDMTPGSNRQRMQAALAAAALNRSYREPVRAGNLLDALVAAGIEASAEHADASAWDQMMRIIQAVDDRRNAWRAYEAQTRDWPPVDCRNVVDCHVHERCVCIAGVCRHAGTIRL